MCCSHEIVLHVDPENVTRFFAHGACNIRRSSDNTPQLIMPCTARWLFFPCVCCEGKRFASADKKGEIRLWDPTKGEQQGQPLSAHKQWVTSLAWEPLHRNSAGERLASSSKDALVKVNTLPPRCV